MKGREKEKEEKMRDRERERERERSSQLVASASQETSGGEEGARVCVRTYFTHILPLKVATHSQHPNPRLLTHFTSKKRTQTTRTHTQTHLRPFHLPLASQERVKISQGGEEEARGRR